MTLEEIIKYKNAITLHLEKQSLHDAFSKLAELIEISALTKYKDEIDEIERSYRFMIQYMADGATDPHRENVYHHIILSTYSIMDKVIHDLLCTISPKEYYSNIRYEKFHNISLNYLVQTYQDIIAKSELYDLVNRDEQDVDKIKELVESREAIERSIFNKIWITFSSSAENNSIIEDIISNEQFPLYFRELIISALLLNILDNYDENKVIILCNSYCSEENVVQIKSLLALLIVFHKYRKRIVLSKNIRSRIELGNFENNIDLIFLQFIRSRDTERITKKMREEFLPELMKISPQIYRKITDKDSSEDIEGLEENPMWQDMLDKSGLTKKMEELNEMQMEGGDVFMGTFAHLKNFPFFNDISNWFMPYHINHSINTKAFGNDNVANDVISKAPFLCNNDKFSFALSLYAVPEMQRKLMLSQFSSQNIDMSEMRSAELITENKDKENIANKYVQDLYRFFKLYSKRDEFYDPFTSELHLLQLPFFELFLIKTETLRLVGEFYFKHGYYNDALEFFQTIISKTNPTAELYQKIGFCYQNNNDIDNAIDYYLRADLLCSSDTWTLRHIAACYRMKKEITKSLDYYRRAEVLLPENINIITNIGHCLLELGNTNEALKSYYKADYLSESGRKAWRPIAWCEFLVGNYEQSKLYYDRVLQDNPTAEDYLNIGHLSLVGGNIKEAVNYYKKSIIIGQISKQNFMSSFNADCNYLISAGIDETDIPLILDKLNYELD
ncbi:MAG: hypothetical protein RR442_04495 [Muribaculaceae bacterium]